MSFLPNMIIEGGIDIVISHGLFIAQILNLIVHINLKT